MSQKEFILVVDDNPVILKNVISKIARSPFAWRYDCISAIDALRAEELYDEMRPAIVISDIQMPGRNGLSMIRRLKEKEHKAKFLVLSGYDDFSYVREAFLLGVSDFILKPVDIKELTEKIQALQENDGDHHATERETKAVAASCLTDQRLSNQDGQSAQWLIGQALNYIETHLRSPLSMTEVAKSVGLSYNHFSKLFKSYTNSSFPEYVNRLRIELTERYLLEPQFKISEIAAKVGYESASVFSKNFKKYKGVYPTEYRSQVLGEKLNE